MTEHVLSGLGAPTTKPPMLGAHYTDTLNGDIYLAKGTIDVDDWMKQPKPLAKDGETISVTGSTTVTPASDGAFLSVASESAAVVTVDKGEWSSRSRLAVLQGGAGAVKFRGADGVSIKVADSLAAKIREAGGVAHLKHLGDDVWSLSGELAAYEVLAYLAVGTNVAPFLHLYEADTLAAGAIPTNAGSNLQAVAFSPDGSVMAVAGQIGEGTPGVRVFATRDMAMLAEMQIGTPNDVVFSPDGAYMAVTGYPGPEHAVRIFNTTDWSLVTTSLVDSGHSFYALAFSPDGSRLAAVGYSGATAFINTATWAIDPFNMALPDTGRAVTFSPDGTMLVVGHNGSPYLSRYDVATKTKLGNLAAQPPTSVSDVAFNPDGTKLAVSWGNLEPYMRVYSTADWSQLADPTSLPAGGVEEVAWSRDGRLLALATGGASPYVKVYDTANGMANVPLPSAPAGYTNCVAFGGPPPA